MNPYNKIKTYVNDIEKDSKNLDLDQTIKMLEAVKEISQSKELIEKVICLVLRIENEKKNVKNLTDREEQIYILVGHGFTSIEISKILVISQSTVATHRKNIIKKLKLNGTGQLRNMAYRYTQEKELLSHT